MREDLRRLQLRTVLHRVTGHVALPSGGVLFTPERAFDNPGPVPRLAMPQLRSRSNESSLRKQRLSARAHSLVRTRVDRARRKEQLNDLRFLRRVFAAHNVVGLGITRKHAWREESGDWSLTFYVAKKLPESRLRSRDQLLPRRLPASVFDDLEVLTDVVEVGRIEAQGPLVTRAEVRPGFSVSHSSAPTCGTLGAILKSRTEPGWFGISNAHVLALCGRAVAKDAILYPGASDGGNAPGDRVGELHAFVSYGSSGFCRMDAAIVRLDDAVAPRVKREIAILDQAPAGVAEPRAEARVVAVGRSSELAVGTIKDLDVTVKVDLTTQGGPSALSFVDQVACTEYSTAGDSGALVLERDSRKAIGLHFAGAPGKASYFTRISWVLDALGMDLA